MGACGDCGDFAAGGYRGKARRRRCQRRGLAMSAEAAFTRSWRVGRYTATLSAPRPKPGQLLAAVIEWEPRQPDRLSTDEQAQYRRGRDDALRALDLKALVIEGPQWAP